MEQASEKDYLQELNELRKMLKWLLNKELLEQLVDLQEFLGSSMIQKYCDIAEQSEHGTNCGYAAKAKDLYLQLQDKQISDKISLIYETWIRPR